MKRAPRSTAPSDKLLEQLAASRDAAGRERLIRRHKELRREDVLPRLLDASQKSLRVDPRRSLHSAAAAHAIAQKLRRKIWVGRSLRAMANAHWTLGENKHSVELHEQALTIFRAAGDQEEIGRTLSASLQPLILLGEYERALGAAEEARENFTRLGDERHLARLEINLGNVYHRQDRFGEALERYERAIQRLVAFRDSEALAVALSNIAVCLISLNDFPRALETYQRARSLCEEHGLPRLTAQADYNIAWLYYLRGEYSRALNMLRAAQKQCEAAGDAYHVALCHLDLSEIYLELNLFEEARDMAHEAARRFLELGMGYEQGKAAANEAIALSQQGKALRALELFTRAREIFVNEKNLVWPWLLDLYQAMVLFDQGRLFEARRLCARAAKFFDKSMLSGKAILCHLLLARLASRTGELTEAKAECMAALQRVREIEAPNLHHQALLLMGQLHQTEGDDAAAADFYEKAREQQEALRSNLHAEELKISFWKNRLEVYERLVELCLRRPDLPGAGEKAFRYIEQAKSRSLMELMRQSKQAPQISDHGQSDLVRRIRDLREELNWYYHRIEIEQLRPEEPASSRVEQLQSQARQRERELLRILRDLSSTQQEIVGLGSAAPVELDAVQARLPKGTALLEYFRFGDRIVAAVVFRNSLEILPVTLAGRVGNLLRLLQFQLSKFRLGAGYLSKFSDSLLRATQAHLRELHDELIAPLRSNLEAQHLIIVPHGLLHYVPFHALFDGESYLIDRFPVSYAPSAAVYALCHDRPANSQGKSLIFGVPDVQAPLILEEVRSVASLLPDAEVYLGESANLQTLAERGPHCRLLHIATHGNFRQDNPMFSGIRLGGSVLNLYDLYQLRLNAELVVLSGCSTGLNAVAGGDELLGLVRGLLSAGSQSLLLTLWDVQDRSTAEFMKLFYRHLSETPHRALALQAAVKELRQTYPHPYFWGPFSLIGKVVTA